MSDCLDCGLCKSCIDRSIAASEEQEAAIIEQAARRAQFGLPPTLFGMPVVVEDAPLRPAYAGPGNIFIPDPNFPSHANAVVFSRGAGKADQSHLPPSSDRVKAGYWLHASCSDEWYGPVLRVGRDAGGKDVLDIWLDLNDFIGPYEHFGDTNGPDAENHPLTSVAQDADLLVAADLLDEHRMGPAAEAIRRLAKGQALFVDLQWKETENLPDCININPPGDGCYRCTQLFRVMDHKPTPDEWSRIVRGEAAAAFPSGLGYPEAMHRQPASANLADYDWQPATAVYATEEDIHRSLDLIPEPPPPNETLRTAFNHAAEIIKGHVDTAIKAEYAQLESEGRQLLAIGYTVDQLTIAQWDDRRVVVAKKWLPCTHREALQHWLREVPLFPKDSP